MKDYFLGDPGSAYRYSLLHAHTHRRARAHASKVKENGVIKLTLHHLPIFNLLEEEFTNERWNSCVASASGGAFEMERDPHRTERDAKEASHGLGSNPLNKVRGWGRHFQESKPGLSFFILGKVTEKTAVVGPCDETGAFRGRGRGRPDSKGKMVRLRSS